MESRSHSSLGSDAGVTGQDYRAMQSANGALWNGVLLTHGDERFFLLSNS